MATSLHLSQFFFQMKAPILFSYFIDHLGVEVLRIRNNHNAYIFTTQASKDNQE